MSMNLTGRNTEFRIKVGSTATLALTITDDIGTVRDLSNTVTYSTGVWKVWKPDGTLLINSAIVFTTRSSGLISYTLVPANTVIANAGIWEGEVEIYDSDGVISEQTKTFNFVIEESY